MPRKPLRHNGPTKRTRTNKASRQSASQRGYDSRWRRESKIYLGHNPLCVKCKEQDKVTAAEVVDHIVPHKGDPDLFWDQTNWQALCETCHNTKTYQENSSSRMPTWIPRSVKPIKVVCGPPAAGKTTYVREHAGPADLILDLDTLAESVIGKPFHRANGMDKAILMRERNHRIARFSSGGTAHPTCWLITTAGSYRERKFWTDFGAEVITLHPGIDTCIMRIENEQRGRDHIKAKLVQSVKKWA